MRRQLGIAAFQTATKDITYTYYPVIKYTADDGTSDIEGES